MTVIEDLEDGDVGVKIVQFENPLRNMYRIRSGFAEIELDEDRFDTLVEIIQAYQAEGEVSDTLARTMQTISMIIMAVAILIGLSVLIWTVF